MKVAEVVAAGLLVIAQATPEVNRPVGLLIGVHDDGSDDALGVMPDAPSQLRTIWVPLTNPAAAQSAAIDLPNLLVPRRSGFWWFGLDWWCGPTGYAIDSGDRPPGVEVEFGDEPWSLPVGRERERDQEQLARRAGGCTSITDRVHCSTDRRMTVYWVWPEFASLNLGMGSGCGVHPETDFGYTVRGLDDLARSLTAYAILGDAGGARFEAAFKRYKKLGEDPNCGVRAEFEPGSWYVERENGAWKAVGWSDTHRLCGYGIDYEVGLDLTKITGRRDDARRWAEVKKQLPDAIDLHVAPGGQWILVGTQTALLVIPNGRLGAPVARFPLRPFRDRLVMVEWSTGPNVARWGAEVERLRATGTPRPVAAPAAQRN